MPQIVDIVKNQFPFLHKSAFSLVLVFGLASLHVAQSCYISQNHRVPAEEINY